MSERFHPIHPLHIVQTKRRIYSQSTAHILKSQYSPQSLGEPQGQQITAWVKDNENSLYNREKERERESWRNWTAAFRIRLRCNHSSGCFLHSHVWYDDTWISVCSSPRPDHHFHLRDCQPSINRRRRDGNRWYHGACLWENEGIDHFWKSKTHTQKKNLYCPFLLDNITGVYWTLSLMKSGLKSPRRPWIKSYEKNYIFYFRVFVSMPITMAIHSTGTGESWPGPRRLGCPLAALCSLS